MEIYLSLTAWQNVLFGLFSLVSVGYLIVRYGKKVDMIRTIKITLFISCLFVGYVITIYAMNQLRSDIINNGQVTFLLRPAIGLLLAGPGVFAWSLVLWIKWGNK